MELIELVSSHVTVPVIGVVLCALMVFTFGFRSPAQPPGFTFEENLSQEKRSKKRTKQPKIKNSANGNTKVIDSSGDAPSKATFESPKAGQLAAPAKPKAETRKEAATQDLKGEKKLKVKKDAGKGGIKGIKTQTLKAGDAPTYKKDMEEDGEWTTIQVSKKTKKPKSSKKEENHQAKPVVEAQHETNTTSETQVADIAPAIAVVEAQHETNTTSETQVADIAPAIADVSPVIASASPVIADVSSTTTAASPAIEAEVISPDSNRSKNKIRKEKLAEKNKADEHIQNKADEQEDAYRDIVGSKPAPVELCRPQSEEQGTSKRKSKKEKKPAGEVPATGPEIVISKELQTSGSTGKKEIDQTLTLVDVLELPSIEPTTPAQKKLKNVEKEAVQKEACQRSPDMQIRQAEKPVETADNSVTCAPSKALKLEDVGSDVSLREQQQPNPTAAIQPAAGICFDEIGDPWVNTATKSKKKKSRREN